MYSEPVAKNDIEEKEEKVRRHGEDRKPAVPKSLGSRRQVRHSIVLVIPALSQSLGASRSKAGKSSRP